MGSVRSCLLKSRWAGRFPCSCLSMPRSLHPTFDPTAAAAAAALPQEVPLFGQLMLGGAPAHAAERRWLLQLLLGGLRSAG